MKRMPMLAALPCLAVVVIIATATAPALAKKNVNPRVIPPQAKPFGLSYGQWGVRYFQWLAAIPLPVSPMNDATGANASVGQSGKVWFLAENLDWEDAEGGVEATIERTITIPTGKAVFVPLRTYWSVMPMNGTTEAELRYWDDFATDHVAGLAATLDGRRLGNLSAYRASSPSLCRIWWPPGTEDSRPPFVASEGQPDDPAWATCEGYWLMLAPLSVGHHELHWESDRVFTAAEGLFDFKSSLDITYHIAVTPR